MPRAPPRVAAELTRSSRHLLCEINLKGESPAEPRNLVDGERLIIPLDGSIALEDMDELVIQTALARNDHNVAATARMLGSTRETLRYRIQKYGLDKDDDDA